MKLRKTKLTAIFMSAMMVASTMSPLTYAAEDAVIIEEEAGEGETTAVEETEETPVTEAAKVTALTDDGALIEDADEIADESGINLMSADDGAYVVNEASIKFAYTVDAESYEVTNDSMEVTYLADWVVDGEIKYSEEQKATAKVHSESAAACEKPGIRTLTVTILGKEYLSPEYEVEKPLEHVKVETKRVVTLKPTHTTIGQAHVWYECSVCHKTWDEYIDLPEQEHTWADEYSYDNFYNILIDEVTGEFVPDEAGLPQLADPTRDGSYDKFIACTEKDGGEKDRETVTILAEKGAYAEIISTEGIAGIWIDGTFGALEELNPITEPTAELPLDNDSIELENCTKNGSYTIAYYDADKKEISRETVVVTAHHMTMTPAVEFNSADDEKQCTVTYNEDGTYTIVNNSCYLPITYKEVIHCNAAGCPNDECKNAYNSYPEHAGLHIVSTEEKTVQPSGAHVIATDVKTDIANAVEEGATFEELEVLVKNETNGKYVKLSNDTSTCTEEGTATVEYLCMVCGAVVKTETVKVAAKGHSWKYRQENYVAPTCTAEGGYDWVQYCERCGEVQSTRHVRIARIKHSNETAVDSSNNRGTPDVNDYLLADKVGFSLSDSAAVVVAPLYGEYEVGDVLYDYIGFDAPYYSLGVEFKPMTVCAVCGDNEVILNASSSIEVLSVQKETKDGKAGSIKVRVTYENAEGKTTGDETYTFDYFSTLAAYQSRVDDTPVNGLHLDDDGIWRYYVAGDFQETYAGIVTYQGGQFFVANGTVCNEANGLNEYAGEWYFLAEGQIQKAYNGLAEYNGSWFYISNGRLVPYINGLVEYEGGTFLFANGQLLDTVNGLWQDFDGTWYFLSNGQVQTQYSGVAMYDGEFFVIEKGVLASDYNGTIEYDGVTFKVVAGQLYN